MINGVQLEGTCEMLECDNELDTNEMSASIILSLIHI